MAVPSGIENRPTNKSQVPGPRGSFLLGSVQDFRRDQLGFVLRMQRDYGPVARFRLGNVPFILVSDPAGVQRILQENNQNYIKGDYWYPIRMVGGDGLFTSEGEHWRRQRRLMQPAFHRQRIGGFAELMTRQTQCMLEGWEQAAHRGEMIDISQEFTHLTMHIITEAMFSAQVEADTQAVSQAITQLLKDVNFRFQVPFYPRLGFPTLRNFRARAELRLVDEVIFRIIRQRRQSGEQVDDLLGMLMAARDEETGEAMSDQQLRDEVITMFIAGHETTAVLLTWLFHTLTQEPEWEQRLVGEVSQALQGRLPTFADLGSLPTLRMAIDETLRLYPPVWITNRQCLKDDELCGFRIRAGEIAGFSSYVIHRLPEYWTNPERFDPLRFSPEITAGRPRFAYIPFGGGPHQCIGNNFALAEAQLIFATLVQRFRLQAVPERPVVVNPSLTLRPKDEVWMKVYPQEK